MWNNKVWLAAFVALLVLCQSAATINGDIDSNNYEHDTNTDDLYYHDTNTDDLYYHDTKTDNSDATAMMFSQRSSPSSCSSSSSCAYVHILSLFLVVTLVLPAR